MARTENPTTTALANIKRGLNGMQEQLVHSLPSHIPFERFERAAMTALQTTEGIENAHRPSILLACQKAAADGLVIDGREAAIALFFDKKLGKQKAQYMPMVQGLLKRARNSGQIDRLIAELVYDKDPFKYNPAMDDVPMHEPDWFGDRGKVIGVYAVANLKNGMTVVEIMTLAQLNQIKAGAKTSHIWDKHFGEMARKTVIRRICKYLPTSSDLDNLVEAEDREIDERVEVTSTGEPLPQPEGAKRKSPKKSRAQRLMEQKQAQDSSEESAQESSEESSEEENPTTSAGDVIDPSTGEVIQEAQESPRKAQGKPVLRDDPNANPGAEAAQSEPDGDTEHDDDDDNIPV